MDLSKITLGDWIQAISMLGMVWMFVTRFGVRTQVSQAEQDRLQRDFAAMCDKMDELTSALHELSAQVRVQTARIDFFMMNHETGQGRSKSHVS